MILMSKLFTFESLYNEVLNDHAPIKQFEMRGNQLPFMTQEWGTSIRNKNKLWKRFVKDRTDTNYASYKLLRNSCTSLRLKAIRGFFAEKSQAVNPREFWNVYRPFLHEETKASK